MSRQFSKFLALVLFTAALVSAEQKTGAKAVLSQRGFNYLITELMPFVHDLIMGTSFEDLEGRASTPIGKIDWKLSKLRVLRMDIASTRVTLTPPQSLTVAANGVTAELTCGWHYREVSWPHVSDSGKADITATLNLASLTFVLGVDETGHPTLKTTGCHVKIDHLKIKLSGGASWLYEIFTSIFVPLLKGRIESTICSKLPAALDALANAQLKTLPVKEPIGYGIGINYALTEAPAVSSHGFVLSTSAEAYALIEGPGRTPGAPVPLPAGETDQMAEIELSEWTLSTVAHATWRAGDLSYLVTKDIVPPGTPADAFFKTDFYAQYAPGLVEKYGTEAPVALAIAVKEPPVVLSGPDGFTVTVPVDVAILPMDNATGQYVEAFVMLETPFCMGKLSTKGENITGEINILNSTTSLVETLVGPVDVAGVWPSISPPLSLLPCVSTSSSTVQRPRRFPHGHGSDLYQ